MEAEKSDDNVAFAMKSFDQRQHIDFKHSPPSPATLSEVGEVAWDVKASVLDASYVCLDAGVAALRTLRERCAITMKLYFSHSTVSPKRVHSSFKLIFNRCYCNVLEYFAFSRVSLYIVFALCAVLCVIQNG